MGVRVPPSAPSFAKRSLRSRLRLGGLILRQILAALAASAGRLLLRPTLAALAASAQRAQPSPNARGFGSASHPTPLEATQTLHVLDSTNPLAVPVGPAASGFVVETPDRAHVVLLSTRSHATTATIFSHSPAQARGPVPIGDCAFGETAAHALGVWCYQTPSVTRGACQMIKPTVVEIPPNVSEQVARLLVEDVVKAIKQARTRKDRVRITVQQE